MLKRTALLIIILFFGLNYSDYLAKDISRNIKALFIIPDYYGANTNLNRDNLTLLGWDIVYAGTRKVLEPCVWAATLGLPQFEVDSLISEIKDVNTYDCVVITSASSHVPDPGGDLYRDQAFVNLVTEAMNNNLVVAAYCTTVRVLAKCNLLQGKKITGNQTYLEEYQTAGAIYQGSGSLPVIDGNLVTSVKGDYFYIHNSNAIETALEQTGLNGNDSPLTMVQTGTGLTHADILDFFTVGTPLAETCNDMVELSDGSILLTGKTSATEHGFSDAWLKKLSPDGTEIWEARVEGNNRDEGVSIAFTDNNIFLLGVTSSNAGKGKDIFLSKIDYSGNIIFTKYFGGTHDEIPHKIIVTTDNKLAICGETYSSGAGMDDLELLILDFDGNILMEKVYGYAESDMAFDMIESTRHTLVISGATGHPTNKRDVWLLEFDFSGNLLLEKTYGAADGNDWGFNILEYENNYFISGKADIHGADFYNVMLVRVDKAGNELYFDKYGDKLQYEFGNSFFIAEKRVFIAGVDKSYETSNNVYLICTDINSGLHESEAIKETIIEGTGNDWIDKIIYAKDKNLLLCGETNSTGAGRNDAFVLRITGLIPDYKTNTRSGHAPLQIDFINQSFGPFSSSEWDFNNDGTTDSDEINPTFVFNSPGTYSTSLSISDGLLERNLVRENYIKVFDGESCLSFPESNSNLKIEANYAGDLKNNFSIEMWLKTGEFRNDETLFDKGSIRGELLYSNLTAKSAYKLIFINSAGTEITVYTPNYSVLQEDWQHLSVNFTDSQLKVYLNGVDQELRFKGGTLTNELASNVNDVLYIGNSQAENSPYSGLTDEIRIWNSARTVEEVNSDFQTYLTGNESGLNLYFSLNEGSGSVISGKGLSAGVSGTYNSPGWEQSAHFDEITGIETNDILPGGFELYQNYPNPFNPCTSITFALPAGAEVNISLYNILGEKVRSVIASEYPAGIHEAQINADNLASGVYIYSLSANGVDGKNFNATRKMILMK